MRRKLLIPAVLLGALAQGAQAADMAEARARMATADGRTAGSVTFREGPNGVLVDVELEGLPAGWHGFHLHHTGACAPDFSAAGGHFAPDGAAHGLLNAGGPHAGDLPNLAVAENGTAQAQYFTGRVTLAPGAADSLFDADGTAVIVHADPDSYGAEAGAGDRIACGVVDPAG